MPNQNIPIFMASDDNYAPFLCSAMYSILENTTANVHFRILDGGISRNSKLLIKESLSHFSFSLDYVDMHKFDLKNFSAIKHYSINTFSRYFIPEIEKIENKILYLDADIIVKSDIKELYNHDLEQYPLGAILEDFYGLNAINLKEKVYSEYKGNLNYFNAGVLLIDLEYFRQNDIMGKLISLTEKHSKNLLCPDQDILNIVFENNFKIIDYTFNYMPDHFEFYKKHIPNAAEQVRDNAKIIHYTSGKPWKNNSAAASDFWDVLEKTKFYTQVKKKYKNTEKGTPNMPTKILQKIKKIIKNALYFFKDNKQVKQHTNTPSNEFIVEKNLNKETAPRDKAHNSHYDSDYFNWQKPLGEFGGWANLTKFSDFITPDSKIIDFGCGSGFLLSNIECEKKIGIEINDSARAHAEKLGIKTYKSPEQAPNDWADIIISNHALEHVFRPLDTLIELRKKLKVGGKIIFVVPCESYKLEYTPDNIDQHIYTWSPLNLGNLFNLAGYNIIECLPYIHKWPPNYKEIAKNGREEFERACRLYGEKNLNLVQVRIIATRDN